ncbi:MAG TPA: hypothetical protein VLQ45_27425 [Thermoanaerobaculia bacterium]|nr:hypothetical protein [Thermoanaerobaculia bacterium]
MSLPTLDYSERPVRSLGCRRQGSWWVKEYAIRLNSSIALRDVLVSVGRRLADDVLAEVTDAHDAAILIIHQGADACWWIVAWWADGCQLYERYFTAPLDAPERVANAPFGAVACSWELVPLMHECEAWERQVLRTPQPSYLEWSKDVFKASA